MESLSELKRLLQYDAWANEQYVSALARLRSPPEAAARILAHIAGAQRIWLSRLAGSREKVPGWPPFDPQALSDLAAEWERVREALTEGGLETPVAYTNSEGEPWTSTTGDILTHVIMHGTYHRGQIARELRLAGIAPPYTDYIHAVRQGFIS